MEELTNISIYLGLGGAAIVTALIQVVKLALAMTDDKWTRFAPLMAILLGIAWNALLSTITEVIPATWNVIVFLGIFTGLAAIGLYSSATVNKT